jgi:hypothetical protein
MKHNFIILSALLILVACNNSKDLNSWSCDGLSGKVKTLMSKCYKATERFGEVEKMDMIEYYDSECEIPLHPAYLAEYNEEGNVVKFTTYDEDGERLSVVKSEYIGNNQVAQNAYDSDGENYYYWKYVFENGIPNKCELYSKYSSKKDEYRDIVFDGLLMKSFNIYKDSVFDSFTERTYYKNLVSHSTSKDADGNVKYEYTNEWTPDGKLLHMESRTNGKKELEKIYTYDKNGHPLTFDKNGNWYNGEAHYTFKYLSYDKHGNWISRVIYSNDKAYLVEERTIEYYD